MEFDFQQFGLDFSPHQGQGVAELDEVMKAMTAGHGVPTYAGGGTGAALLRQDLANELYMQTFRTSMIKFWPKIAKPTGAAANTVFEYRRQTGLGTEGFDQWQDEGEPGAVQDSTFEALVAKCRFISQVRLVSAQMANLPVLGPQADAIAKATSDANTHILTNLEDACFNADSSVNPKAIDGLRKTTIGQGGWQVVDKRGAKLDPDDVSKAAVEIIEAGLGMPNQFWGAFGVKQYMGAVLGDRLMGTYRKGEALPTRGGGVMDTVATEAGEIPMEGNLFLSQRRKAFKTASGVGETIPATPALTSVVAGAPAGAEVSLFIAADAGDYTYIVEGIGPKGKSASVSSGATTVAAGEKVTITITAPAVDDVLYYKIYRNRLGTSDFYEIGRIRQTYAGTALAATVFTDLNAEIPGMTDAYLLENTSDVLHWKSLMNYSRIQLPMVGYRYQYGFAMFGTLLITLPQRIVLFKNCAPA